MSCTDKMDWTQSALDSMCGSRGMQNVEIEDIDYYIHELDKIYSEPLNVHKQVAWLLSELSLDSRGHSAINAIEKIQPAVVRITTSRGYGSGIIIDEAGYIVTNNHVVYNNESINVILWDGRQFEGEIVDSDPIRDLAIVKIDSSNLPIASLGDSNNLLLGQDIIAIGYPLDLPGSATVSKGIISAFREFNNITYIQTDAAINPGSSGGALINVQGELIGINVGKKVDVSYEGISYAITINAAKPMISILKNNPVRE